MRRLGLATLLCSSLGLAGCNSTAEKSLDAPKPIDKMSTEEWCEFYGKYLATPNVPDATRKLDVQRMRERGCPNTPAG